MPEFWGNSYSDARLTLSSQIKFLNITELEAENHYWRRIVDGLPTGQLSFLLRAGSDTLPNANELVEIQDPGLIPLQALSETTDHNWTHSIHVSRSPGTGKIHVEARLRPTEPGQVAWEGYSEHPDLC